MNLWADLDNNYLPPDTTEHRHTRRLTERAVLSLLRTWLLNDYAAGYCRSLATTRIFRRCYWIDALGTDAKTKFTEQAVVIPGSSSEKKERKKEAVRSVPPILQPVVSLSQHLAQESRPLALCGLILDGGSSKRKDIRQDGVSSLTKEINLPRESGVVHGSWLEIGSVILKEIEQVPAIFLLNPFGATMFTQADLALLHQRSVPTELCLLLSHKQIETHLLTAQRSPAQASLLTSLLRTDRWKMLPMQEEQRAQAIDGLIELFSAAMKRHFLLPIQRIILSVQTQPAMIEPLPYTLLFATRRQDSLINMNDAVCMYNRRVYEQSHRGVLGEEWFVTQQRERFASALEQVYERASQLGRTQRIRRWPDLRQQILLANFGKFALREYDTIMQKLLSSGVVRCEWRQTSSEIAEERVPGPEDTLIWR